SFSLKKSTITETFTIMKEINAPKLMNEAINPKLRNIAEIEITPINKILNVGVLYLGCNAPKNFFGNCPSRPIAYKIREPLACDESAEPIILSAKIVKNMA